MSHRPKVVCITQARTTSTRLPRKVLLDVMGKPLLAHHIGRLQRSVTVDEVVLATTTNASDDEIAALGARLGVKVARGPEHDVLARFVIAARMAEAEVIVRVTSDCPLIDPVLLDQVVAAVLEDQQVDYAHLDMNFYPRGLDVEVFRRALLDQADQDSATTPYEREHVTPYIYHRPERYHLRAVAAGASDPAGAPGWRWCVDEPADFELVSRIMEVLLPGHPDFSWRDCDAVMRQHPDWGQLNQHVRQKGESA